jgi:hypothetical protein
MQNDCYQDVRSNHGRLSILVLCLAFHRITEIGTLVVMVGGPPISSLYYAL